jgi:exopolysaccharide biosynthesis polyprenyl glycosylphosphotransferase
MSSWDEMKRAPTKAKTGWTAPERVALPSLRLRVSERRLLLVVVDMALLSGALVLSLFLRTNLGPQIAVWWSAAKWFGTLALAWLLFAFIFDVYDLARAASMSYSVRASAPAALLAGILYLAIPWFTPPIQNRTQGFLFLFLAVNGISAWRLFYARFFVQPAFQRRSLVVGAGISGQILVEAMQSKRLHLDANPFRGTSHNVVGFVDDNPACWGHQLAGIPVLGESGELVRLVHRLSIDEIIIAITDTKQIRPQLFEAILDCREIGLPITTMATVYERLTGRVAVEHSSRNVELAAGSNDGAFQRFYGLFKRLTDLFAGLVGLVVLGLSLPFVWLGNRLWSPGPLFFRQKRVGQGGRPFTLIKYRSMIPNAEQQSGAVWAARSDSRITTFGSILRRTHLDELPQVINVLRNEMSLVGPRPERPEFVGQLSEIIPFYRARHCLKPGITGWAQIHQDYGDSIDGAREKLEYDLYYVKNATPSLDMVIILRTVAKMLGGKGR